MRRVYAYLLQKRFIDRDVLTAFVREKLIYESVEPSKDGTREYHNAVFVGFDERGVPRHAYKRGLYTEGKPFKGNVFGGDRGGRIAGLSERVPKSAHPETELPGLLRRFNAHLRKGGFEKAFACTEDMAALSLFAATREYRQMGRRPSPGDLSSGLQDRFRPHQNRGGIQNRAAELAQGLQTALSLHRADGVRSKEQKQKQADARMDLALGCVKAIIGAEANEMKREQDREQNAQEQQEPSAAML
jgi:hypothetical protein